MRGSKTQAGSPALTVRQYSDAVLDKYLRHRFAPADPRLNASLAAEELLVLMHKLRGVKAGRDSEDAKAPLKAIRDAIDAHSYNSAQGADAPEVNALFQLFGRLEEICEEHIAGGHDQETALDVQEALRYRLTRLVTGDQWEGAPKLKLRVLKLMFSFMVRENERIMAAAGSRTFAPPAAAAAGRSGSTGRSGLRAGARGPLAVTALPYSRWGEAINEISRMPGSRMLPLFKLCLLENLQLSTAAEQAAAAAVAAEAAAAQAEQHAAAVSAASAAPTAGHADAGEAGRSSAASAASAASVSTDRASVKPTAGPVSEGPGPAVRLEAPAASVVSPSTPARPGRLRAAPPSPPPPAPAQQAAQQAAQQQREQQERGWGEREREQEAPPQFSLDDLLGLRSDEGPVPAAHAVQGAQEGPPSALPSLPSSSAEKLFAAFDAISPAASGEVAGSTAGATGSGATGNPFASFQAGAGASAAGLELAPAPSPAAGHGQLRSLPISSPGARSQPEPASPSYGPSSLPGFASFTPAGQFSPGSAPGRRAGAAGGAGSLQAFARPGDAAASEVMRQASFGEGSGSADAHKEPSPYLGKLNPFGDTRFSDLAPELQAQRPAPSPPQPAPPAGPPMRSLSSK